MGKLKNFHEWLWPSGVVFQGDVRINPQIRCHCFELGLLTTASQGWGRLPTDTLPELNNSQHIFVQSDKIFISETSIFLFFKNPLNIFMKQQDLSGWRDHPVVKSTGYSSRGLMCPLTTICIYASRVPSVLSWPLWAPGTHVAYRYKWRKHTHTVGVLIHLPLLCSSCCGSLSRVFGPTDGFLHLNCLSHLFPGYSRKRGFLSTPLVVLPGLHLFCWFIFTLLLFLDPTAPILSHFLWLVLIIGSFTSHGAGYLRVLVVTPSHTLYFPPST